jgi:hypothetical protein
MQQRWCATATACNEACNEGQRRAREGEQPQPQPPTVSWVRATDEGVPDLIFCRVVGGWTGELTELVAVDNIEDLEKFRAGVY